MNGRKIDLTRTFSHITSNFNFVLLKQSYLFEFENKDNDLYGLDSNFELIQINVLLQKFCWTQRHEFEFQDFCFC